MTQSPVNNSANDIESGQKFGQPIYYPIYYPILSNIIEGFTVIRRFFQGICCTSPIFWRDLVSFAELLTGFSVIRRIFDRI